MGDDFTITDESFKCLRFFDRVILNCGLDGLPQPPLSSTLQAPAACGIFLLFSKQKKRRKLENVMSVKTKKKTKRERESLDIAFPSQMLLFFILVSFLLLCVCVCV